MAFISKTTTKDGQPRYKVRWRVGGRAVEKWAPTLAAARALKTQAENDELTGVSVDPRAGARLLNDYFDGWLNTRLVKGRALTPSTRTGYARLWRRTIEPTIGRHQLRSVRPETVRSWYGHVSTTTSNDQAAKAYRLRAVMATAEAERADPGQPVPDPRWRPGAPCRAAHGGDVAGPRPCRDDRTPLPRVGARGRVRRTTHGESLGLRRIDVDLLHGELRVVGQAQEVAGRGGMMLEPKSEAGKRTVVIPGIVVEALDVHLAAYTAPEPEAPVFTGPEGTALRRATLSKEWAAAVRSTGAPAGCAPA